MFKLIENDSNGKLDLLVNNCYAAVGRILGAVDNPIDKFWECDPLMWDEFNDVGLRAGVDGRPGVLDRLFVRNMVFATLFESSLCRFCICR